MRPESPLWSEIRQVGTMRPLGPLRTAQEIAVSPAADHGRRILEIMLGLARRGRHVTLAALAGSSRMKAWRHYPEHDADDAVHRSRFYYHAHGEHSRGNGEHGHFHIFHVHASGDVAHLLAISMSDGGLPLRLFLTNRWVTGERWSSARQCHVHLHNFHCEQRGPLAPVAAWLTAMIGLYHEDICRMHVRREQWLEARHARDDTHDWLESRRHEVLVSRRIDLPDRLARLGLSV